MQSVALRVLDERERLIQEFVPEEFWEVSMSLGKSDLSIPFSLNKKNSDPLLKEEEARRIETLINNAETIGFDTVGISKQGEALLALGLAERLYGIQKEFKKDLSNALLRREALLRLVDPVCLGDFKWFVFKKFNEKKMNINSTCLR